MRYFYILSFEDGRLIDFTNYKGVFFSCVANDLKDAISQIKQAWGRRPLDVLVGNEEDPQPRRITLTG